jgi:glycosyltransferase involved in cell wall biosynthesis
MHVGGTGEQGIALRSLVKYHGLAGKVILSEPDNVGFGVEPLAMPLIYSALDVYLTTTQGEGWGLPALEAMACGVPVVAPRWSGLGSWAAPAALLVPCDAHAMTAPTNLAMYTVGGIPSREGVIDALDDLYDRPEMRDKHRLLGLELAHQFSWGASGEAILNLLGEIVPSRVYNGPKRVAREG